MPEQFKSLADALRARKSDPADYDEPSFDSERVGYRIAWKGGRYLVYCEPTLDGIEKRALALEKSARAIKNAAFSRPRSRVSLNQATPDAILATSKRFSADDGDPFRGDNARAFSELWSDARD